VIRQMNKRSDQERATLQLKVSALKQQFGCKETRLAMKKYIESRLPGRQQKWRQTRLFALWLIVQCHVQLENRTVNGSCRRLEALGGIFADFEYESKVRNQLVSTRARIHRLYYDAETAFNDLDVGDTNVNGFSEDLTLHGSTLREKLRRLAAEIATRGIFMSPVMALAERFVLECMKSDDLSPDEIIDGTGITYRTVNFEKVKYLPDGKLWRLTGTCSEE
jgi:hypothetical protein